MGHLLFLIIYKPQLHSKHADNIPQDIYSGLNTWQEEHVPRASLNKQYYQKFIEALGACSK